MNENTNMINVEAEALTVRSGLTGLAIVDQETYNKTVEARVKAKEWLKGAEEYFDGLVKPAYASYKNLLDAKKKVLEPVEATIKSINNSLVAWDQEQERIRREAIRVAEEAARVKAEEERLAQAVALEAAGAPADVVEEFISAELVVTAPVEVEPTYEKGTGITYRTTYSGEVTDMKAFIKAVAKNPALLGLVQVNGPALNAMARSMKETLNIPGVKLVETKGVASR